VKTMLFKVEESEFAQIRLLDSLLVYLRFHFLNHCHFFFHRACASIMALSLAIVAFYSCVREAVCARDSGQVL
jgi:hypothetical protein